MRAALPLAALLLLALVPTSEATSAWTVDATVVVESTQKASLTVAIGLTNTILTYGIPSGATFVEARDTQGQPLAASVKGSSIEVTIRSRPAILRYDLAAQAEAPLTHFRLASLGGQADSPTTVRLTLPAGWTYVSAADRTDRGGEPSATIAADGTIRATGGGFFDYVVARPGLVVPPADPTVSGEAVRREAEARVALEGVRVVLTQTYDTDVYSRQWSMPLPEGARVVEARSPLGPIPHVVVEDEVRITTPYPTGLHLGGRSFTVEYVEPAPLAYGGAFVRANLSVRAQPGDDVRLRVAFDEALTPTGWFGSVERERAPWEFRDRAPLFVSVAALPPAQPGHARFAEGLFVVDAPASREAGARAAARNASELLPMAASFAANGTLDRPFYAAFTEADVFAWEEGFYSNGLNTISIRAATLANATSSAPRMEPVRVLVHEATHALLDRALPDAGRNVSFFHEGLSRLAESRVEDAFPESEAFSCNLLRTSCSRESARPNPDELYEFHRAGTPFAAGWSASSAAPEERGFLYDYSGLVMRYYDANAPQGALEAALQNLSRTQPRADDAAEAARILDTLRAYAPGAPESALLYPGRAAASLPLDQFRYCMRGFVAPPYPWEDAGDAPKRGCPASGYAGRDAELPPLPPTPVEEPAPPTPAAIPAPTPPAPTPAPIVVEPEPTPEAPTTPGRGEAPAGVAQPTAATPGVGPLLLVALLALAARLTRR